jgi:hypothetical protein
MGIINLPAFESTAVEQPAAPQENPAFQGLAAMQQARSNFLNTLVKGAASISQYMIDTAITNQYNKAITEYSEASQQKLLELEREPVTSVDPRFSELTEEEQLTPNLSVYNKWKQGYLEGAVDTIGIPVARQKFQQWTNEKGLAETEALAKFDIATNRSTGRTLLARNLEDASKRGDKAGILDLVENAKKAGFITEAEAIQTKDTNFEDIASRELYMELLKMPTAPVPEMTIPIDMEDNPAGMTKPGTVDLNSLPAAKARDGSKNAMTITVDRSDQMYLGALTPPKGTHVETILIPTVGPDGKKLSNEEAIALYKKTGQNLGTFKDQASADAYANELSAAAGKRYIPAQESGLEFLADINNTKYTNWDGEERTLSLGERENLVNKYKVHLQEVSIQKDAFYSDVHIRADSLQKVDQALAMLWMDNTLTGTQKYNWEMRFKDDREYYLGLANLKTANAIKAHDEWMKQNEDAMRGQLALHASRYPNDFAGLRLIIDKAYDRPDKWISGKFAEEMYRDYTVDKTPAYKLAVSTFEKRISKMPAEKQYKLMGEFIKWYQDPAHQIAPTEKQVQDAMNNLFNGEVVKAFEAAFPGFIEKAGSGALTGVVAANIEELSKNLPFAVEYVNTKGRWPEMGIQYGVIDETNEWGFGEGNVIMFDAHAKHAYALKKDGKEIKLYSYVQPDTTGVARAGKGEPQGAPVWQEVGKAPAGGVSAKEAELRSAEAAAELEAKERVKTQDRALPTYGVEHDPTGGWFLAGEPFGSRHYFPTDRQKEYDSIWEGMGGR